MSPNENKPHLLVVDDERFFAQQIAEVLALQGLEVTSVASVNEALNALEQKSKFDAVFTDIMMAPGEDFEACLGPTDGGLLTGLRLAEHIRSSNPDLPIIAYTASPSPTIHSKLRSENSPFNHVISKRDFPTDSSAWADVHERFIAKKLERSSEWVRQSKEERDLVLFEAKPELFKQRFEDFRQRRSQIVVSLNENLVRVLNGKMEHLPDLSPRDFEEVCAHSLTHIGYDVTITPTGPDDGIDLIAISGDPHMRSAYIVQCKRNRIDLKVETPVLKQLRCVVDDYRASGGIVMTSSYFTSGAQRYARENQYRLQLFDVLRLKSILEGV